MWKLILTGIKKVVKWLIAHPETVEKVIEKITCPKCKKETIKSISGMCQDCTEGK